MATRFRPASPQRDLVCALAGTLGGEGEARRLVRPTATAAGGAFRAARGAPG